MSTPHINALREHLMDTLSSLRDKKNPMEPDRARAVAQVASVLVDTARVEVDFIKATGEDGSGFLTAKEVRPALSDDGKPRTMWQALEKS